MSSRKLKLSTAICLSISALVSMTPGVMAEQTITEFAKTEIMNGNPPSFRDDLKKVGYGIVLLKHITLVRIVLSVIDLKVLNLRMQM